MDSRARLVDNEWLAEIQRREHRFLPSPHPLCPQVTPDVFNDGKWMAQHGFEHPLLVLERLPSIHLPDNLPLTLVAIANLIGRNEPLHVIDVDSQSLTKEPWTVEKWTQYFGLPPEKRKRTLNVISLEFSHTPMAQYIRAPYFVQRIDWVHALWPPEETAKWEALNTPPTASAPPAVDENVVHTSKAESTSVGVQNNSTELGVGVDRTTNEALSYPKASYYFLTGVAGCFTDFHVDFGGSSVWYTVLKGQKEFFAIPPTEENLAKFEQWSTSPNQEFTFFGDLAGPVMKIVVKPGQTLLLPSGWIHAVYTPYDSLVFGGNYIHQYNVDMQIKVAELEDRTAVPYNSRFPFWWLLQFYYLKNYVNQFLEHHGKAAVKQEASTKPLELTFPAELPLWERKGLLALLAWMANNSYKCPADVLDHPLEFYTDAVSCRLRGVMPLSFAEWDAQKAESAVTCFCGQLIDETIDLMSEEVEWIGCDWCSRWCHLSCALKHLNAPLSSPAPPSYYCPTCTAIVPPASTPPPFMLPSPLFAMQRVADQKRAQQAQANSSSRPRFTLGPSNPSSGAVKRPLSFDDTESSAPAEKRLKTEDHFDDRGFEQFPT